MPADHRPPAIFLMGPTASGKTALACALAERFPLQLVSVDSALVYRGLDIGAAKPDAASGLQIAVSECPDLIFLDIVLPGMSGFEALRQLRREPATRAIPIIMMSGNEQATEQFYVQKIGADDFMKKPFSRPEVFARIERLLDDSLLPRRSGRASVVPTAD